MWCLAIYLLLIAKSVSLSAEVCQLDGQWYDPNYSTRNAQVKRLLRAVDQIENHVCSEIFGLIC